MTEGAARRDVQHITRDWELIGGHIDGVEIREVRHIVTRNGQTTELHRRDWEICADVAHIVHVSLRVGTLSAWHKHKEQTDHIFCVAGMLKVVLYDDREGSATLGKVDVFNIAATRPMLLVIPPGIWHGIQNVWHEPSCFVNYFDREYRYEDPDEWRLPADTDEIPYRF
jgi:dTDP-4-dehydrorhamnose 3,5-epimerase